MIGHAEVLAGFLALLRDAVREAVREELGRGERDTYTSLALPPDCPSRRTFAEWCRRLPEAERRGREWSIPRAVWEARRVRRRGSAPIVEQSAATSLDARADALLARAGLRVVR